jgi:hypothetical protein
MKCNRAGYITKIFEYRKRREAYRKTYKGEVAIYKTDRYKLLTKRIGQWRKEIKRLEARKVKIEKITREVNRYFSVDIRSWSTKKEVVLARMIYFKIGLESGICGTHLARHIGRKSDSIAAYNRKKLIHSYQKEPNNRIQFYNFKNYFKTK